MIIFIGALSLLLLSISNYSCVRVIGQGSKNGNCEGPLPLFLRKNIPKVLILSILATNYRHLHNIYTSHQ